MTESEFDALLRRALIDVINEDYADIMEGEPDVPPHTEKYLRRKRKLLADPIGYVRRLARPVWKKALRMVACILLALATLFGTVMAVSPSARAWVAERVSRWTQTYTEFFFSAEKTNGLNAGWRPNYVPDGFEETDAIWDEISNTLEITYKNYEGDSIRLSCGPARQGNVFGVDNEHSTHVEININGRPADLYISSFDNFSSRLFWSSKDGEVAYMLRSRIDYNELLAIAAGEK